MYELYIKVENGKAVEHPAFASNLLEFYPSIPDNYEPFFKVKSPETNGDQVLTCSYQKINGVWTNVWSVRDMTEEELKLRSKGIWVDQLIYI